VAELSCISFFFFFLWLWLTIGIYFIYLFLWYWLGLELRVYTLSHSTSPLFMTEFLKIGSQELFAWAGFEPQSS
jgi:hypothetical protein